MTEDLLQLVNASPLRFDYLNIKGQKLVQIANDGNALSQPVEIKKLLLTPG